ncbi:MAG: hypothetical protein KatS3mg077_2166 [Candidatus Binatia bacterium]|nr:MAG: hypothetical protein KatS3mg077_2166 [Candidatus Binatia bacterium]
MFPRRWPSSARISILFAIISCAPVPLWAQAAAGTLQGVVRDQQSKEPVIDAGVELVGTGKQTRTDLDGRFKFTVPPGRYEIRVFAPFYRSMRVQNLMVAAGQVTETVVELLAEGEAATETVEVVAKAERGSARVQMELRREATSVSENISAQEIRVSPDSDAGEIVLRLPAVVVKDDKYINVRGLNERYSAARLQGSRLPSTDPERRVVPLDLFPAEFIESVSLVKTFQPDLPGDFSGALADIYLKSVPEETGLSVGLASGREYQRELQNFRYVSGSRPGRLLRFGRALSPLAGHRSGPSIRGEPHPRTGASVCTRLRQYLGTVAHLGATELGLQLFRWNALGTSRRQPRRSLPNRVQAPKPAHLQRAVRRGSGGGCGPLRQSAQHVRSASRGTAQQWLPFQRGTRNLLPCAREPQRHRRDAQVPRRRRLDRPHAGIYPLPVHRGHPGLRPTRWPAPHRR